MDFARLIPLSTPSIEADDHPASRRTSRRDFLKSSALLTSGLVLGFHVPSDGGRFGDLAGLALAQTPPKMVYPPNAFIRIAPDETITIIVSKLEFGQGVFTSLPMLIAEELDCDWSKIRAEHSQVAPVYNIPAFGMQLTGGSMSVASSWQQLRVIGASARQMLLTAAAQQWSVDAAQLQTKDGFVLGPNGKKASYGSLADAAMKLPVPENIPLKTPKNYKLIGKPTRRIDAAPKVDGSAQFSLDKYLPGMKFAVVAHPPVFGGKIKKFGWTERPVKGFVKVLPVNLDRGGKGVVVIADNFWDAKVGRDKLELEWEASAATDTVSSEEQFKQYRDLAQKPGPTALKRGDLTTTTSAKSVTAEYEFPYLAHAPMEPLNCVIDLKADSCKVWSSSQIPTMDRSAIATTAGLKTEQVELITLLAGGGFGRRATGTSDYLVEATNIAKTAKEAGINAPLKIVWTREDDIKGGYYRPAHVHRVVAGLDAKGKLLNWNHAIVGQSITKGTAMEGSMVKDGIDVTASEGVVDQPYTIPNFNVSVTHPIVNVPVLWWRSVGHTHNGFVMETMIDEMAALAKQDPLKFRLAHLDPRSGEKARRHIEVLNLVAAKSGWGKPLPRGHAHGLAVHESFKSVVAEVAEVSISNGEIKVHKVTAAVHCGTAVNPLGIEAQVQGAVVFGLSAALHGKITFKDGKVEQSNFHDYQVLRMNEAPQCQVFVVPSTDAPTGMGEPGVPPIAPAVANAVFKLTGKRLRKLPLTV